MKKLFIVQNHDWAFLAYRKEIAITAKNAGWDVTIVTYNTGRFNDIKSLGLKTINLPINATGMNPIEEMRTFSFLYKLYKNEKPDVIHHVGLKTILWGSLAAKLNKISGVVNAVNGLGVLFSEEKISLITRGVLLALRFSHNRDNIRVIFQNHEDENLFLNQHIVKTENCEYIKGSGINLDEYSYTPEPASLPIIVIFTARMLREKGIVILTDAAERLRKEYEGKVVFLLCGMLSDSPKAIQEKELRALCDGKYIQWLGHRTDVKELLCQSHIMAFPSFYREGVPKSLIESCAIGRPIVTTDSVGCRDSVDDGSNGFLVPVKDSVALADKLKVLIDNKSLREKMGRNSRLKAEKEFSLSDVVDKHLKIYESLYAETKS